MHVHNNYFVIINIIFFLYEIIIFATKYLLIIIIGINGKDKIN